MKKILMLVLVPLIILFFPFVCYASSSDDLSAQLFQDYLEDRYDFDGSGFNNNYQTYYTYCYNYWIAHPDYKVCVYSIAYESQCGYLFGPDFEYTAGKIKPKDGSAQRYAFNRNNHTYQSDTISTSSSLTVLDYDIFTMQEFIEAANPIDWDTIYYNPQIPVPKLDVWYLITLNSYLQDYDAIVNANIDVPDNTEFYVELAWKWSVPEQIRVYSSDIKGTPAYDYGYYTSSELKTIYSLQDMQQSINVHVKGEELKQVWQDYYDTYYDNITFYTTNNNVPSNWLANARLKYIKKMGTQLPMYGNRLEVFARYWSLSEDNKVVVGKWYHWQSARGSATEEPPENYVNYQALPGYEGTVENVPTDNQNTYDGVGVETGVPAQTVIQYAPNYPDYPTVASYNKDNLLVSSIQKLNEVKVFFGEFNDFLSASFIWIPSWIWAIIGAGFALSIIVFFLRML